MKLVLLHGPLTGPAVWRGVADAAAAAGWEATVPDLPDPSGAPGSYYDAVAEAVCGQLLGWTGAVLCVHSAAGGLADRVIAEAPGVFSQLVFVDAILPHPGRSWFSTVGDGMARAVRDRAVAGYAAPWDQWFPAGALGQLIPDPDLRQLFLSELRAVPLQVLDEPAPAPARAPHVGWSYLRLSKVYEDEAALARREGRPTLRMDLHHLASITHPSQVLANLRNLVRGRP